MALVGHIQRSTHFRPASMGTEFFRARARSSATILACNSTMLIVLQRHTALNCCLSAAHGMKSSNEVVEICRFATRSGCQHQISDRVHDSRRIRDRLCVQFLVRRLATSSQTCLHRWAAPSPRERNRVALACKRSVSAPSPVPAADCRLKVILQPRQRKGTSRRSRSRRSWSCPEPV
ncbi:hypothetical protein LMG24238_06741 [Paraburkholderia sediminicola]|uniref:Uncharacterized protein n=1 Tax=Paraburkholderia sediminicola TaxID=458836 RepID=A0A6J5CMC2_9BURK|nr:hypothetical protein LMG24238_06741 [Paraburkholderia sediminicola]